MEQSEASFGGEQRIVSETITENELIKAIQTDFPEVEICTAKLISNGWDNIALDVNDEYIFRFPKNAGVNIEREMHLLQVLRGKFHTSIPVVEFIGRSYVYIGYRKIPGESLTRESLDALSDDERKALVDDLATFLFDMHNALSPDEARKIGIEDEDAPSYKIQAAQVERFIADEDIRQFTEETILRYGAIQQTIEDDVVLFNDLHEDNLAFDPEQRRLHGVFDFGDVMIGDIHRDFHPLYRFDPKLMYELMDRYEQLSGRKLDRSRPPIYNRIGELCDFVEYGDKPESAVYRNAVAKIREWMAHPENL